MPTVDVVDLNNEKVDTLELSDAVFAAEANEGLVHQVIVAHQANQRAGTHKVKTRGEVAGSGRKLWRQKGTGRAPHRLAPLADSGAVAELCTGRAPRSYQQKVPRKMQVAALRSTLSARLRENCITVVRDFELPSHRTKEFRVVLETLGLGGNVLVVENQPSQNLELSSRNLPEVKLLPSSRLNPYVVLKYRRILMSASAARTCSEVLA